MDIRKLNHAQLQELISKAERRKQELSQERVARVRDKVLALLKTEGFTFDEVFGTRRKAKGQGKYVVKPKYRNPGNPSQTWAGRGKQPRWYSEAISAGKKEKDLLIA
jgi:DNA-binding protein H-NS